MTQPELSIIVVSYNTKQITKNCIDSIVKSLHDSPLSYEIIVVDNASKDGSIEMLKGYMLHVTRLKVVKSKTNLGFGKGNNLGVKHARGEYVLLLNSDVVVLDNAIEKLYDYFRTQETFQFVGGKLLNKDLSEQPSCGPFYSLPVIVGALFLKGDHWNLTRYSPKKIKKVDWVSGACILTKKKYFQKLSGFDEEIFMYMEEIDLLYRARKIGFQVGFYPETRFIHLGSASSAKRTYPILQVYQGFLYLYKKHRSPAALILLKILLQLKALIALGIGKVRNDTYLKETYEKAYQMAQMDR